MTGADGGIAKGTLLVNKTQKEFQMRDFMIEMFGETIANDLIYRQEDGQEWVLASDVCSLLGIQSEYSAVKDLRTREFNLTEVDKRKFYVPEVSDFHVVWFVSETGFWKILGRSHSARAQKFRSVVYTQMLPDMCRQRRNLMPLGNSHVRVNIQLPFIAEILGIQL